ncbi:MAG: WD40/YVTN/BNR-like repeat-containing protein, partial [Actinomycetota bacterium]
MPRILVAAGDGLRPFDERGLMGEILYPGRSVTALAPAGSDVWAVIDGSEIWHDTDGATGHVADLTDFRATCLASVEDDVFVGSSGAHLFRLAGAALEPVVTFEGAEGRTTWYTPWGGPPDTRSIANWDDDVYVNIHVGGILRSHDRGEAWTPTIDIDADVHQVTTANGMVFAACAGGLAASTDRGSSWSFRTDGLEAPYARAVAVSGSAVLITASNGPRGGHAAVYRADLEGGPFERCLAGPGWFDGNIDSHHLDALP